jgi:hypothetical protein
MDIIEETNNWVNDEMGESESQRFLEIKNLLEIILSLSAPDQFDLMKMFGESIKDDRYLVKKIFQVWLYLLYPNSRLNNLQIWMESRFRNNMRLKPSQVAYECCYYKLHNLRMVPFVRSMARRVKDRLRKRMKKEGLVEKDGFQEERQFPEYKEGIKKRRRIYVQEAFKEDFRR